jgi:hypothetical protein
MASASADRDTTSSATAAVFAHPPKSTTQSTEFAMLPVLITKSGTPSSGPADVSPDTTWSTTSAPSATPEPKSTTTEAAAATALMDTKRPQDKDATESAHLFAQPMKIIS